ncbi:MAG: hypothetical protein E7168_01315 [Firmicutes bacterium]|nr:hypothetical protein [Bacillota bacterium]
MIKKITKRIIFMMAVLSLIVPIGVIHAEEETSPTPTATPKATPSPSPTPTSSPSPSPSPTSTPTPTATPKPTGTPEVKVTLTLDKTSVELEEGETITLKATVKNADDTSVKFTSSDEKIATVDSKGKVTTKKAGNVTITAISNADDTARENCDIKVVAKPEEKDDDASIKNLTISNGTISPVFTRANLKYAVKIKSNVSSLTFKVTLNSEKAEYKIDGNKSLKNGSVVKIVVTAEAGNTQTYEFEIEKEATVLTLKSLKIRGYTLNQTFKPENTEYTLDIPYEAVDVTVQAAATSENASVSVTGSTSLSVGKNIVSVTVKDSDGNSKVYKITVTRAEETVEEEEEEEEKEESNEKEPIITSEEKPVVSYMGSTDSTRNDHTLKYILVSIGCLILLLIGILGIYFYIKTSSKDKPKKTKTGKKAGVVSSDDEFDEEEEDVGNKLDFLKVDSPVVEASPITSEDKALDDALNDMEGVTKEFPVISDSLIDRQQNNETVKKEIEDLFDDE